MLLVVIFFQKTFIANNGVGSLVRTPGNLEESALGKINKIINNCIIKFMWFVYKCVPHISKNTI